jgi:5S rRNA maturation endonuclease (ribonuclease M5)
VSAHLDIAAIKQALRDPIAVCRALGLEAGAKRQGGGIFVRCPAHDDASPSCSVTRGADGTIRVRCFGCSMAGDVFDLVAAVERLDRRGDFRKVAERAAELAGVGATSSAPTRPAPPPPPPKPPPPVEEVRELWERCTPTCVDPEVSAWLRSRAIDPAAVDAYGPARALPVGIDVPRWARYRGDAPEARPWNAIGYRCIVPLYDAAGELRSVRARQVGTPRGDAPKALPPVGYGLRGLVMGCPLGSLLLALGAWPWWAERRVVVVEGEPDFLTWAARGEGARTLAVLGLPGAGTWTVELADRIPDGSTVIIRTDPDDAGDRYATEIATTLRGRCTVLESDVEGRAERRGAAAQREAERRGRRVEQTTLIGVRP